jgi:hypothetical protein
MHQTAFVVSSGLPHPTQQVQILKKVRQTAITICSRLSHLTRWAALPSDNIAQRFFQGQRYPSEDINSHLFLMNKKRLKGG